MGKGGGGGQPTQQTVTQTNLPEYARPYFENLLERTQAESYRQYTPYGNERVAGFDPAQTQAFQQLGQLQRPEQLGTASNLATAAGIGSMQAGQYTPGQFTTPLTQAGEASTGSFVAPGVSQQFMSPYMQDVVNAQKREAITDAQKAQLMTNLGAARQGTYGGARQLLAGTERERALGQQLGDIQAKGLQSAYENAQKAFEAEQARRLQAQGMNLQYGMQSQLANQEALMKAQQMAEQSRQFGSTLGLQGLSQALQGAQTLGALGEAQQAGDLQRIQAQAAAGAEQRAYEQQLMDTAYADFLRQRDYPMEQLGYYSSILRGLPMQMGSTQTSYAQPPSMASQVGGLGLAGLSLSKLLGAA